MKNLNVLFLWHMHQPLYHVADESLRMPWVRMHGLKDYLGMARIVSESEAYRMTFNFTPILWEQLEKYSNGYTDRELEISLKSAASLSMDERRFLLAKMFRGNPVSLIKPYSRYLELFEHFGNGGEDAAHRMTEQDINDLVVWRILSWIYPDIRRSSRFISRLMEKGRDYSDDEKLSLIKETLILIETLPEMYNDLFREKQIDLTTTPYYHPILPLIIDSETAIRSAGMKGSFPAPFAFPEDAEWHVKAAIEKHRHLFNSTPEGMWPAEGSVSQQAADLFSKYGIKWIASDEAIIQKTLSKPIKRNKQGDVLNPEILYKPALLQTEYEPVFVFFRDRVLSDLIGFDYQSYDIEQAVDDFVNRLCRIRDRIQNYEGDHCVSIILDGENAWEHYPDGGFSFLKHLFSSISKCNGLYLNTFSDYLKINKNICPNSVDHLLSGSWIDGDFGIWIGQQEENQGWAYLKDASDMLSSENVKSMMSSEDYRIAKRYLRAAQGSDSFWWFGDVHYTAEKAEFDSIFRELLINAYKSAGITVPRYLYKAISPDSDKDSFLKYPNNLISPVIDGEIRSYYDWFGAGESGFDEIFSSMHHGAKQNKYFKHIRFGFDTDRLYLRIDPDDALFTVDEPPSEFSLLIVFNNTMFPSDLEVHFSLKNGWYTVDTILFGEKTGSSEDIQVGFVRVIELSIPFGLIQTKSDQKVSFHLELFVEGRYTGRSPGRLEIEFFRPTDYYDDILWRV
jgi:alpha-amylase/alpha-mannosidase (GH57 family)